MSEGLEQKHHELHVAHEALKAEHALLRSEVEGLRQAHNSMVQEHHARIEALEQHAHSAHAIQPAEMDTIAHHTLGHLHKAIEHHLAPKA